jgi:hypothetical protein
MSVGLLIAIPLAFVIGMVMPARYRTSRTTALLLAAFTAICFVVIGALMGELGASLYINAVLFGAALFIAPYLGNLVSDRRRAKV